MNRRKLLAIFLAALMAAGLLAGCNGKTAANTTEPASVQTEAPAETTTAAETTAAETTTAAPAETTTAAETAAVETAAEAETEAQAQGSIFDSLPQFEGGTFVGGRDQGDASELMVYETPDGESCGAYKETLVQEGFTVLAENEINENTFATLSNGEADVTLIYAPSEKQTYIVAEPAGVQPPTEEENVYETVCEPLVVMLGVNYDNDHSIGLCFVYRLADGSFIVVDGGSNSQGCADSLYTTMQKLAPDPKNIVIAAWFITHAHADHVGCFYAFSDSYASRVTLERLVYNFPSEEAFTTSDTAVSLLQKYKAREAMYPNAQIIKTHPGQIFRLRDAVVEMLFTWDLYPVGDEFTFFNNSSLVFSVEIGGQKVMQLGDCGPKETPVITRMYGETLDSDFIQVAHHGLVGATPQLNELINAEIVLWPTSESKYKSRLEKGINKPFTTIDDQYVADKTAWVFHLPYSPDTVESWELYHFD